MSAYSLTQNDNGRRFLVRVVTHGDGYGLDDCLTHEEHDPMVEFYDYTYAGPRFGSRGQFVSRYYFSDLHASHHGGLNLYGGDADWRLDPGACQAAMRFVRSVVHQNHKPGAVAS